MYYLNRLVIVNPVGLAFLLTVKEGAGINRDQIVEYLEQKGVQTRMLFSGNLVKQPCFDEMRQTGKGYRVIGNLTNTDRIMNHSFWIGVYPGLTKERLDYVVKTIEEILK